MVKPTSSLPTALRDEIAAELTSALEALPDVSWSKEMAFALHYRRPAAAERRAGAGAADCSALSAAGVAAACVVEIKPRGVNRGGDTAFMQEAPFAGREPVLSAMI